MCVERLFEKLTGQVVPNKNTSLSKLIETQFKKGGIDHSQFNEILLMLGYDRVVKEFFNFLADPDDLSLDGISLEMLKIDNYLCLEHGVHKFQKFALLFFGNTKYAFKTVSSDSDELRDYVSVAERKDASNYSTRNRPMIGIEKISPNETHYLGYIIQEDIAQKLRDNPGDKSTIEQQRKMEDIIRIGKKNNKAYLFSDHLDVYVATSMRLPHEYVCISNFTNELFTKEILKQLNLRWFDPTQAYCSNRIDKGLAEALMLKRAKCTLYLAQESDTLGKDSELASTLAQGKPVIAYIPIANDKYFGKLMESIQANNPQKKRVDIMLEQLQIFDSSLAWRDREVMDWILDIGSVDEAKLEKKLRDTMKNHYDKRAKTLVKTHPLGIQVNLATGVANGVLVVRSIEDCAKLIYNILTQTMEFELVTEDEGGKENVLLKEAITGCVFRVMTGNSELTNAFWNFYLDS